MVQTVVFIIFITHRESVQIDRISNGILNNNFIMIYDTSLRLLVNNMVCRFNYYYLIFNRITMEFFVL